MKRTLTLILLTITLLSGCMTPEDKAERQAEASRPQLGVTFQPEWWTENAVVVRDVPAGSAASAAGIMPGDRIVSFNGQSVTTVKSLNTLELQARHGASVPVGIMRNGQPQTVTVALQ
jgi:S1-C subfamily serine protease